MTAEAAGTQTLAGPRTRRPPARWLVPTGLILLSLVPVIAGAIRLTELTSGTSITPQNARFFASPVPVVTHIISVSVYCLLGAFQFVPSLRRGKRRGWHRIAGRILVPAGLVAALSGLWMSAFYPLPDGDTDVPLRIFFGSAMLVSLVLGLVAIRSRDFVRHSAWMTRGYAIGLGAGSQVVVTLIWVLAVGPTDVATRVVLMGAAWVINLAVAEYVIRRRSQEPPYTFTSIKKSPMKPASKTVPMKAAVQEGQRHRASRGRCARTRNGPDVPHRLTACDSIGQATNWRSATNSMPTN